MGAASPCTWTARALANALARMERFACEATWRGRVDVLSFGATKGGALAAEAVLFFDKGTRREHVGTAQARRPSVSKHRFIAARSRPISPTTCG
jgi:threonine aldolase